MKHAVVERQPLIYLDQAEDAQRSLTTTFRLATHENRC